MSLYEQTIPQYRVIETPLMHDEHEYESPVYLPPHLGPQIADPIQQRMVLILGVVGLLILSFVLFAMPKLRGERPTTAVTTTTTNPQTETAVVAAVPPIEGAISPIFAREVKYWEPQILKWATLYNLDPNIIATIMQIESCGDPQAVSSAGATGLFQVMPFHFDSGEDMFDPDTNAMRGMNYYNAGLQTHQGDVFLSFAGYNGGHGTVPKGWDNWPNETQRYYYWAKGIYEDAQAGLDTSPRLNEWFSAGGASLCRQSASRLGMQ